MRATFGHANVHIGCSGFSYPHWKGPFYPADIPKSEWLRFYCTHFDTVEINASFYRFPQASMLAAWKRTVESVNRGFLFTLKGNRTVTHLRRIRMSEELRSTVERFYELFDTLVENRACVLWQMHPRMKFDTGNRERIGQFCAFIAGIPDLHAIEFRDTSWWNGETFELLRKHDIAFCIESGLGLPEDPVITAGHAYFRFHGPSNAYSSEYSETELRSWADVIVRSAKTCRNVFCYFNNDVHGYAVSNAGRLREMVG